MRPGALIIASLNCANHVSCVWSCHTEEHSPGGLLFHNLVTASRAPTGVVVWVLLPTKFYELAILNCHII